MKNFTRVLSFGLLISTMVSSTLAQVPFENQRYSLLCILKKEGVVEKVGRQMLIINFNRPLGFAVDLKEIELVDTNKFFQDSSIIDFQVQENGNLFSVIAKNKNDVTFSLVGGLQAGHSAMSGGFSVLVPKGQKNVFKKYWRTGGCSIMPNQILAGITAEIAKRDAASK